MKIAYIEPLTKGWDRMVKALFKPFNINKWFALGFTVFLAELTELHPRSSSSHTGRGGDFNLDKFFDIPHIVTHWLTSHPLWFTLIVFGLFFLIAIIILFTWLSSRGRFMFLDNVVHDRYLIKKPWQQFKEYANSLFRFRLCYGLITLLVIIAFIIGCFLLYKSLHYASVPNEVLIILIFPIALFFLSLIGVTGFIDLFMNDFVVPIMYKKEIKALKGWGHFFKLLKQHFLHFIFYGMFRLVLGILAVTAVVIAGLFTCCIGLLFLIIPYIGSVITLPISYTFRAFNLEYLRQFGDEYDLFSVSGHLVPEENK